MRKNYYKLGFDKYNKMDFKSSIIFFSKSIKQNPNHIFSYLYRGLAYIETQELEKAIDDLNFVLKLDPDNQEAISNLKIAKENLNK